MRKFLLLLLAISFLVQRSHGQNKDTLFTWDVRTEASPYLQIHRTIIDSALERMIVGIVKDRNGRPLPNATVKAENGRVGTITDAFGQFQINLRSTEGLNISNLGYNDLRLDPRAQPSFANNTFQIQTTAGAEHFVSTLTQTSSQIKQFPIPYPRPSATLGIRPEFFSGLKYYYQVDSILSNALDHCRYDGRQYYYLRGGGFALVTQMEQINDKGFSLDTPARWSATINGDLNNVVDWIKALFSKPVGYYRVLVFTVSPIDLTAQNLSVSEKDAQAWISSGYNSLPIPLRKNLISDNFTYNLIVYHYTSSPGKDASQIYPDPVTGEMHFDNSRLAKYIVKKIKP